MTNVQEDGHTNLELSVLLRITPELGRLKVTRWDIAQLVIRSPLETEGIKLEFVLRAENSVLEVGREAGGVVGVVEDSAIWEDGIVGALIILYSNERYHR